MGACMSGRQYRVKLENTTDKIDTELEDVEIELNLCEKRLQTTTTKVTVLNGKLRHAMAENEYLKAYVVALKDGYTDKTLHLKKCLVKEKETAEYFQVKYNTLNGKLQQKKEINLRILHKYVQLENSKNRRLSAAITNASSVSSTSFF